MDYEHDSREEGALKRAESRMKTTRRRYRQERSPVTPETMQRVERARELRTLKEPVRQALDAFLKMLEGTVSHDESVPVGTVSQG